MTADSLAGLICALPAAPEPVRRAATPAIIDQRPLPAKLAGSRPFD